MNSHVRKRIKELRTEYKLTAKDMAERLEIHVVHYREMENGTRRMNPAMTVRIAAILGTTYKELTKR